MIWNWLEPKIRLQDQAKLVLIPNTECVKNLDEENEMIFFELILTTFESSVFFKAAEVRVWT